MPSPHWRHHQCHSCIAPLRIKVHDAIDVSVALIVGYYGNVRDYYGDGRLAGFSS